MIKNNIKPDTKINPKFESRCEICRWYLGNKECCAFSDKISDKIWKSEHNSIIEGQLVNVKYDPKGDIL